MIGKSWISPRFVKRDIIRLHTYLTDIIPPRGRDSTTPGTSPRKNTSLMPGVCPILEKTHVTIFKKYMFCLEYLNIDYSNNWKPTPDNTQSQCKPLQ